MARVFDLLKEDHRKVEQLFDQFERTGDPDVATQICDELSVHATLEEELIYPVLRANVAAGMADEARDEHQEAKNLIARIYAIQSDDAELKATVQQLREAIEHHVQEEESEVFPKMEAEIPHTISLLGNDLEERKKQLQAANPTMAGSVSDKPAASGDPVR